MSAARSALVLGGGVVGLSVALSLIRKNWRVSIIDPFPSPGGASYGNAGLLSPDTATPIALPGMLPKVPKWLMDPLGPLTVRVSYLPKATPWLLKWIAAGRIERVREISRAMRALHKDSLQEWRTLLGGESFADLIRTVGTVQLWDDDAPNATAQIEEELRRGAVASCVEIRVARSPA
jgi:Glycine/D-amino acid oxidases (deaminating)